MPKTAGSSFRATLECAFGADLLQDYGDIPINTPVYERNKSALENCLVNAEKDFQNIRCIHGHFLPIKYLLLSHRLPTHFITWLRHPITRAISHYYFWKRIFDPVNAPPLHRKMVEENWSFERFSLGPELRDFYCQFLYGFPLEYFSFIGITEFYDEDHAFFAKHFLNASYPVQRINCGDAGSDVYGIDGSLRQEIEQYHAKDMALYERALAMRHSRCSTALNG